MNIGWREHLKLYAKTLGTVARFHHKMDDYETAIQVIKKCIELDPEMVYYRDQLEAFEDDSIHYNGKLIYDRKKFKKHIPCLVLGSECLPPHYFKDVEQAFDNDLDHMDSRSG